jgi:hypothetical protein
MQAVISRGKERAFPLVGSRIAGDEGESDGRKNERRNGKRNGRRNGRKNERRNRRRNGDKNRSGSHRFCDDCLICCLPTYAGE